MHARIDHLLRLSEAAEQLDSLPERGDPGPIDLASIVEDRVTHVERLDPDVAVRVDVHGQTTVLATDLIASAVENLLENCVNHHPGSPTIEVSFGPAGTGSDRIRLAISDDGPGFSVGELALDDQGYESSLHHSDGIGLWLARWIVQTFEGRLTVENTAQGALVTVLLTAASVDGASRAERGSAPVGFRTVRVSGGSLAGAWPR